MGGPWSFSDCYKGDSRTPCQRGSSNDSQRALVLESTKTSGAEGVHHLAPIALAHPRMRCSEQAAERLLTCERWPVHLYQSRPVSLVFTNTTGGFVGRPSMNKVIECAARRHRSRWLGHPCRPTDGDHAGQFGFDQLLQGGGEDVAYRCGQCGVGAGKTRGKVG
jgi:hypothetical protein